MIFNYNLVININKSKEDKEDKEELQNLLRQFLHKFSQMGQILADSMTLLQKALIRLESKKEALPGEENINEIPKAPQNNLSNTNNYLLETNNYLSDNNNNLSGTNISLTNNNLSNTDNNVSIITHNNANQIKRQRVDEEINYEDINNEAVYENNNSMLQPINKKTREEVRLDVKKILEMKNRSITPKPKNGRYQLQKGKKYLCMVRTREEANELIKKIKQLDDEEGVEEIMKFRK